MLEPACDDLSVILPLVPSSSRSVTYARGPCPNPTESEPALTEGILCVRLMSAGLPLAVCTLQAFQHVIKKILL